MTAPSAKKEDLFEDHATKWRLLLFNRKEAAFIEDTDWIEESLQLMIARGEDINSVSTFHKLMGSNAYSAPLLPEVAAATTRHLDISYGVQIIELLHKYGADFTDANKECNPLWYFLSAVDIEEQRGNLEPVIDALINGGSEQLSVFDYIASSELYERLEANGQDELAACFSPEVEAQLRAEAIASCTPSTSAPSRTPRL